MPLLVDFSSSVANSRSRAFRKSIFAQEKVPTNLYVLCVASFYLSLDSRHLRTPYKQAPPLPALLKVHAQYDRTILYPPVRIPRSIRLFLLPPVPCIHADWWIKSLLGIFIAAQGVPPVFAVAVFDAVSHLIYFGMIAL